MKNELKAKYKQDFKKVSFLVNEIDLCGLIKGGAPPDEYDCLTDQILNCLYKRQSRAEIKGLIINELVYHFKTLESINPPEPYKTRLNKILDILLDKIDASLTKDMENL